MSHALTIPELAEKVGATEDQIRRWCHQAMLPYTRLTPRGPMRIAWTDWEHCRVKYALKVDLKPRMR